jgi:hypothetical protein
MTAQIKKKYVGVAVTVAVASTAVVLGLTARPSAGEPASAPAWFAPIAASYGNDPRMTPDFDFASLYSGGYPEWFAGIAEYYDHNPLVTPEFDFASLYSGDAG